MRLNVVDECQSTDKYLYVIFIAQVHIQPTKWNVNERASQMNLQFDTLYACGVIAIVHHVIHFPISARSHLFRKELRDKS